MSIADIYRELITQQIIREVLTAEQLPTPSVIAEELATHEETHNLSQPQHKLSDASVEYGEASSAAKHNATLSKIYTDLKVLYRALLDISNSSNRKFERWREKATLLEDRLVSTVDKIGNLLLIQEETAGYHNYIQVDLRTLSDIDLTNTTVRLDTKQGHASIGTSNSTVTRYFPLDYIVDKDLGFVVLTRKSVSAVTSAQQSRLRNAFDGSTAYWQERIYTSQSIPISVEIQIRLGDAAIPLSRVDVDLHAANRSDVVQVLPMYSEDGKTWNKLPIADYLLNISDKGTFQFSSISAKYFKFILTKTGPDLTQPSGGYIYEFGVDDIAFFNEAYSTATAGKVLITNPLSVIDQSTKANEKFSKVALDTCEMIELGTTDIEYAVVASNDADFSADEAVWMDIAPSSRVNPRKPIIVDFGEVGYYEKSDISISYDSLNTNSEYVDPKQTFTVLTAISGLTGTEVSATASAKRYLVKDPSFKILDFEISADIDISKHTIELWRNVNTKGSNSLVRGLPNGWGVDGDYYKTTVLVKNTAGIEIDFGPKHIIIDETLVSGSKVIPFGVHQIKVHKDNFLYVDDTSVTTLALLKTGDNLYPYNHRYLVEGFNYPSSWSNKEEKIYSGFDIVGEYYMSRVGVSDILESVQEDDFARYAIDVDAADTGRTPSTAGTGACQVFLVRVDNTTADFTNEKYYLRFRPANVQYEYLRLKATLKTTDEERTPYLSTFKVKLGN